MFLSGCVVFVGDPYNLDLLNLRILSPLYPVSIFISLPKCAILVFIVFLMTSCSMLKIHFPAESRFLILEFFPPILMLQVQCLTSRYIQLIATDEHEYLIWKACLYGSRLFAYIFVFQETYSEPSGCLCTL